MPPRYWNVRLMGAIIDQEYVNTHVKSESGGHLAYVCLVPFTTASVRRRVC